MTGGTEMARRRRLAAAVLTLTSLAAAGCWPQPGAGPGNQNHNGLESTLTASNAGTLTEIWTAGGVLDSVYGNHVLGGTDHMSTGLPPAGSAYVTSLDAGTGALNWQHDLQEYLGLSGGARVIAPPVVVDDQVWTGWNEWCQDATWRCKVGMAKLDLATGERTFTWPDGPRAFVPYGEQVAASFQPCSGTSAPLAVLDPAQPLSVLWQGTGASVSRPVLVKGRLLTNGTTTLQAYAAQGCGAGECAPQWTADLGITVEAVAAGQGDQALVLGRASGGPTELVAVGHDRRVDRLAGGRRRHRRPARRRRQHRLRGCRRRAAGVPGSRLWRSGLPADMGGQPPDDGERQPRRRRRPGLRGNGRRHGRRVRRRRLRRRGVRRGRAGRRRRQSDRHRGVRRSPVRRPRARAGGRHHRLRPGGLTSRSRRPLAE